MPLVLLAMVLALAGWLGAWSGKAPAAALDLPSLLLIELVPPSGRTVVFARPGPVDLSELLAEAGLDVGFEYAPKIIDRPVRVLVRADRLDLEPLSGAAALAMGQKMDLNRALARDLVFLPGIGPSTAQKIVLDRTENGPYESLEDMARVRGIGRETIERLRPLAAAESELVF
jgi:competence ComEA-like helix-hairpin-helix protein